MKVSHEITKKKKKIFFPIQTKIPHNFIKQLSIKYKVRSSDNLITVV